MVESDASGLVVTIGASGPGPHATVVRQWMSTKLPRINRRDIDAQFFHRKDVMRQILYRVRNRNGIASMPATSLRGDCSLSVQARSV